MAVVPRVLPLFVDELRTTTTQLKADNLKQFVDKMDQVFKCRVEVEDLIELLLVLFAEFRTDSAKAALNEPGSAAFSALRVVIALFDALHSRTPLVFRALRQLTTKVNYLRKPPILETRSDLLLDNQDTTPSKQRIDMSTSQATSANLSPIQHRQDASLLAKSPGTSLYDALSPACLEFDAVLQSDTARGFAVRLLGLWDAAGIDIACFTSAPETLHVYLPHRLSSATRVYRDFITCTRRPKLSRTWGSYACVHIKTSIRAKSDIMYRFLVEGYNYGVNAVVLNDVVGVTNRHWDSISPGTMAQYGYPESWDREMTNDYAPGATISQYYSSDGHLTLRLKAKSMFCVGFSVSAWLVFHGYGNGAVLSADIHHQDEDL